MSEEKSYRLPGTSLLSFKSAHRHGLSSLVVNAKLSTGPTAHYVSEQEEPKHCKNTVAGRAYRGGIAAAVSLTSQILPPRSLSSSLNSASSLETSPSSVAVTVATLRAAAQAQDQFPPLPPRDPPAEERTFSPYPSSSLKRGSAGSPAVLMSGISPAQEEAIAGVRGAEGAPSILIDCD